ncbi:MAG TPA: transporter [Hyphomicrobium sp.]|nr:transporter [Hyphomicrobium sp.]
MKGLRVLLSAVVVGATSPAALAVEGPTAAGPIGGTDIRSAQLPPPGIYFGTVQLVAQTIDFLDGNGKAIPALSDARLTKEVAGPFLYYIPQTKIFGGSIAFAGIFPAGNICGKLFTGTEKECDAGIGDPYVEVAWSRFFGTFRPSSFVGAYPIPEGLSLMLGFGTVVPVGQFDGSDLSSQARSMGTNIWDFAPTVAFTYTTPPILAEGTEFSAKIYWNNYLENPETNYLTGDLINIDFAVSEHIGRFQVGVAGFYAFQVDDDRINGVRIPPDGRQGMAIQVGGVVAYDMPEYASSVKLKVLASPYAENTVTSWSAVLGWIKKY